MVYLQLLDGILAETADDLDEDERVRLHAELDASIAGPFFAVRTPPAERSDVREALARHGLKREQTLEVLGTLAKRSISNPCRLALANLP